jgi:hypothetical protein
MRMLIVVAGERQSKAVRFQPLLASPAGAVAAARRFTVFRSPRNPSRFVLKLLFGLLIPERACALRVYRETMNPQSANTHYPKLKPEAYSTLYAVVGCGVLALVLVGVCGTIYKMISPGGWITQAFGYAVSAGSAVLVSLAMIALLAWFSHGRFSPRGRNRHAGLFVYGFALAGIVYLLQLLRGTF